MPRGVRRTIRESEPPVERKVARTGRSVEQMLKSVPMHLFAQMVAKSGMPADECRELCNAFRELRK